jgi:hypothetical protein
VQGWLAEAGLHAWVVQRELADPVSYVSLWLSDAGETPEETARRGGQWLDWFAEENIAGVGMGLISLRAPAAGGSGAPDHVFEEISGAGEVVTGPAVDAFFARPGPDGWQQVGAAVRRPGGPAAVIGVDEVSNALLAGCRGEVPLGTLIELLAIFHGVDADALAEASLPVVREAIGRAILYEAQ